MAELNNIYTIGNNKEFNDYHYNEMPYPIFEEQDESFMKLNDDAFEKWMLKNCYYQLSFYNQPNYKMSFPWDSKQFQGNLDERNIWWYNYPLCQQLLNCMYVMQQQPNLNYNHLISNVFSTNSHAAWMRGGRLASLVDYMISVFRGMFDGVKFSTEPISADATTTRDSKLKREQMLFMLQPFIEKYLQDIVKFPKQQKPFETPQQIQDYMDTEWKDLLADDYKSVAKNLWKNQYWEDDVPQVAFDVLTNDLCGIEHIVINGIQHKLLHRSWNLIYDNRVDEPYGRRRRFSGALIQETPSDLFARCPQLDEETHKKLYKIAIGKQGSSYGSFPNTTSQNSTPGYIWSNSISNFSSWYNDVTLDIVRLYWIAPEKIKGSDKPNLTVYTAEIIENKYMVNYGKANNIVYNKNNPQEPMLPLQVFTPNMKLGFPNSPVQRIRNIQDKIDKIEFKREELIGKADGNLAFLDAEPFGNNTSPTEMQRDLKLLGYTYIAKSPNGISSSRLVETWDRRLDPSFSQYYTYKQELENEMQKSIGQIALAADVSNKYIGKQANDENTEKGSGDNSNLLTMTAKFVQMNLEMAVNIQTNLIKAGLMDEQAENMIGKDGLWRMKNTKDRFSFDFGIPIELNDKFEQEQKNQLFELMIKLQNPNDPMTKTDIAKLYMIGNVSKFMDELKAIEDRIKKERQDAMQMNMQVKQQEMKAQQDHEKELTAFVEDSKQKKTETLIKPKQEKLDTERAEIGMPPLHPELQQPPTIPQNNQQPPVQTQGQPNQQIPQQ